MHGARAPMALQPSPHPPSVSQSRGCDHAPGSFLNGVCAHGPTVGGGSGDEEEGSRESPGHWTGQTLPLPTCEDAAPLQVRGSCSQQVLHVRAREAGQSLQVWSRKMQNLLY